MLEASCLWGVLAATRAVAAGIVPMSEPWRARRSASCQRAARASGINVTWTKIFAFLVSGVFVAMAALCVVGQTATGDARSGQGFTLNSVAAAVIGGIAFSGGKGNYLGAAMGGIILGLLINIIYFANITSFYQEFMKGVIIIVALLIGAVPRLRRRAAGQ